MFNWTTTTILNSLKDASTGIDLVKVWTDAEDGPSGFSGEYPIIKIKRDHTFESRYITKIYKAVAKDPEFCELTVNCDNIATLVPEDLRLAHLRLSFYVTLEGDVKSTYANDGYRPGKPFSVGFDIKKGDDGAKIATSIKKNAEKFGVFFYGSKVLDFSVSGSTLTIKGTHESQRFKSCALALDEVIDEDLLDSIEEGEKASEGTVFTLVKRGANGFGTYHHLAKDLRLPTAENTRWLAINANERPTVGAKYDQYIINYCAPSMANPGVSLIGQHQMSSTTHVFWVNEAVAADFEAALAKASLTPEVVALEAGGSSKPASDAGKKYSTNHEQSIKSSSKTTAAAEKK